MTNTRPAERPRMRTIFAAMIAGACTFLNVYCTQPLLPLFRRLFHASEVEVSMTVGVVTLAVALMAPVTGMVAETIGRKKVIVPALVAMALAAMLTATSPNLYALIFWRFVQGLFVPGVIAVIIAYINEEFPHYAGTVMSAYVSGTVFGGFFGRFLTGIVVTHWSWQAAFVALGTLNLLGALAVRQWLPRAVNFAPSQNIAKSLADIRGHLRNPRLLAICGMGFTVLFGLVGVFTYVTFYLAQEPFHLTPAALGSVFFVYLLGCVVTPASGRFLDRYGFRRTTLLSAGMSISGLLLTLSPQLPVVIVGLAVFSSGIFISQSAATVLTGRVVQRARSTAAGLYVTLYYAGGSVGSVATAWFWHHGGWPACVGLFVAVSLIAFGFSLLGGRSVAEGHAGRQ